MKGVLNNSNTSHVVVNRPNTDGERFGFDDSNTSHVVVNLSSGYLHRSSPQIQIHLMLLLIFSSVLPKPQRAEFKYISCCC